ncbi:protein transport protein Sec31A isoform X2 [Denticeps clupeoides]|uniref:protein transport protein Sec31A isoform X2 n=1 Tax=Denticeps clupeoides TaxID=299321 RepID=UPI0010A35074|nr:protein transport protein Sec31A isoform X2 [Denticeps clupeoides]
MKLKEINRTAIQAWSPAQHHPVYLATGTSAQQLDATFSTSASLEIFELDLAEHSLDMKSSGTFSSPHRYHKLVWGPHESDSEDFPMGVLIAGGENGNIILYDPSKIVSGSSEVVIDQSSKHTGPVRALDVNSFQTNLVASGANESEIYIWDLNSFNSPMTPGPKSQPLEDISCVAWNRQVQHILASASPSGRASVWDLRKNDLIIKVSDHSNRMHCSGLAWNPDVATQLVLASEDDRMPVIQMWDLRFATSPLKVLENHTRGVLAIAWSLADPELLLSCGKDNRILCWNPNTAEVLYELPTSTQWCFDIQWCPRNPAVLSAASFDGHISVYSIMGGSNDAVSSRQADQISTSFGNLDPFGTGQTLPPLQLPHSTAAKTSVTPLKKPPKWIRRPVGASFAFGGKLVSLDNSQPSQQQQQHVVRISQVVTETTFLERSNQLQATLSSGSFVEFCQTKISAAPNEFERTVWSFLKVNFESDSRGKYLELLGYKKEELAQKVAEALEAKDSQPEQVDLLKTEKENVCLPQTDGLPDAEPVFNPPSELKDAITDGASPDDDINLEAEEEAAKIEEPEEMEEPEEHGEELECFPVVETEYVNSKYRNDVDGLITQALLTGDFESAVDLCLHDDRMADSIILAIAGGPELLEKTQKKYFSKSQSKISKLISAVVMKDWRNILETCDLHSWRESLAAVMTYAKPDEFSSLCGLLGSRLDRAEDQALQTQACLCYICAGSLEKLVTSWAKEQDSHCPLSLQDLVEKVVILQQAVEKSKGSAASIVGPLLAQKMSQYASLLASQGSLDTALSYLPNTDQLTVQQLRDRLSKALGHHAMPPTGPVAPGQTRRPEVPAAVPGQGYTHNQHQLIPQQTPAPVAAPAQTHAAPQYYQQARSASTITSWSNQTPTALPSVPRPLGPVSDLKTEPTCPGFGLQSPVNAAPAVSSGPGLMFSQQYPQTFPHMQQFTPGVGGPAIYNPLQYSSSIAPPPLPPSSSASAPMYPGPYSHSQPPAPSAYHSAPATHPPPPACPSSSFSPALLAGGASFQHGGLGSPASHLPPPPTGPTGTEQPVPPALVPASQRTGPQNGWNDPPALNRGLKKKKVQGNFAPPAPITAPIMGEPPAQMNPCMQALQPGSQALYNPNHQQTMAPSQPLNPTTPMINVEGAPGAPIGDVIQPLQSIPTEKITKKPIPEEHLILKTTFEGLIQKCLAAAADPQTKRKLDDATKRLEFLYDKLRDQSLSPAIVGGLHNIAQSIESRAYTDGLGIHTHIVSSSNFSETSAFMPVLKVVLTQANKLGV